jgi:hypothetical protein
MKWTIAAAGLALGWVFGTAGPGFAQVPTPGGFRPTYNLQPAFSPYLNLLRSGTNPAINYYGLVRPQNAFYSSIRQLQTETGTNAQGIANLQQGQGLVNPFLAPTGHVGQFMNYSRYFMTPTGVIPSGGGYYAGGGGAGGYAGGATGAGGSLGIGRGGAAPAATGRGGPGGGAGPTGRR